VPEPTIVSRDAEPYLSIPVAVTMESIGPAIPQAYAKLSAWMSAHGVEPAGAPFVRYNLIDMERELQIEVGVPVRPGTAGDGPVLAGVIPGGRYASLTHIGPYEKLYDANAALQAWAAERGLAFEQSGPAISPPWSPPQAQARRGPAPGIEYAGFWIRTGAYLIDTIPFLVIGLILIIPMMAAAFDVIRDVPLPPPGTLIDSPEYQAYQTEIVRRMTDAMGGVYGVFALFQLISIAYFVGMWAWVQQTLGMMAFGLRVVRDADGRPLGLGRAVLRYVGYWLSWVALFIGFIWVAFDDRKQGWHDKIAGSVVVRRTG
jgi:uncharacterized RDD family membrane protein YckC/effector-binding domain-containing protein